MKTLQFGLFENAQANDSGTARWRHPENRRDQFDSLDYWREIARISESGGLDFIFLADAWGWAEVNGERPDVVTEEGLDLPRLDPVVLAAMIIAETDHLGVVMTGSTLLEQPYAFARRMATLDHLSGGRVGWNIVTTGTADTAVKAFGTTMVDHDERYMMADDFMNVAYKLWEGAWEPDALVRDKQGVFADARKVHRIAHEGKYFTSHGYGNTSYSPQGTPVLFQAGTSPAGRAFGAAHAECVFLGGGSADRLAEQVALVRAEAAAVGRDPQSVKIMSAFSFVLGEDGAEARRKHEHLLSIQTDAATVASYAWFTGLDLSSYSPNTLMASLSTELSQTQLTRFADKTVGDVLRDWHLHGVGVAPFVGTAREAADHIIDLAEKADLDGFLIQPVIQPGSTEDFIRDVMPVLRERGRAAPASSGTLRERLFGTSAVLPATHPAARQRPSREVRA